MGRGSETKDKKKKNKEKSGSSRKINHLLNSKGKVVIFADPESPKSCPATCTDFFYRGKCVRKKCRLSHDLTLLDHVKNPEVCDGVTFRDFKY